jgi:hypothetical protein
MVTTPLGNFSINKHLRAKRRSLILRFQRAVQIESQNIAWQLPRGILPGLSMQSHDNDNNNDNNDDDDNNNTLTWSGP